MRRSCSSLVIWAIAAAACGGSKADSPSTTRSNRYDLRALFTDWRAFQKLKVANGVPDYSQEATAAQQRELPSFVNSG